MFKYKRISSGYAHARIKLLSKGSSNVERVADKVVSMPSPVNPIT